MKHVIAFTLVIALGIILAIHITLFWIQGDVTITESNRLLRTIETIMTGLILIFGVYGLAYSLTANQHRVWKGGQRDQG